MADRVHLVRHGEVDNPRHLVYADLPGFTLSERGRREAGAAAAHLAGRPVAAVAASPLQRAADTAAPIAAAHGLDVVADERLLEWGLALRWAGIVWEDLPVRLPGELEAYLSHPEDLSFSPESLDDLAHRVAGGIADFVAGHEGEVVVVSHQDPVQAARLHLTGRPLAALQHDKPGHCSVTTLRPGRPWVEESYWEPDVGSPAAVFPPIPE